MKLDPQALVLQRALAKMTQKELAAASSLSLTSVSQFEAGKLSPRKTTIYRLAQALGIEASTLCKPLEEVPTTLDVQTKGLLAERADRANMDEGVLAGMILHAHVQHARKIIEQLHRRVHAAGHASAVFRIVDELRDETQSAALVIDGLHRKILTVEDPDEAVKLVDEINEQLRAGGRPVDGGKPS